MISPKTVLNKFENYLKVHQINNLFNKYNQLDKNRIVYILRHHEESQCRDDFSNIMSAICSDDNLKKQFVDKLSNGMIILRLQKLIDLFNLHNYQTDSLTIYNQTVGLRDNQGYVDDDNNVVLSFPYKDTILQGSMSTPEDNIKKRFLNKVINQPEINELKEPKVMYHVKYFDKNNLQGTNDYSKFSPKKDSLFIKGNNLEALYSLLPIYKNKVKLIYIDPPYNTGSKEFDYNDDFGQSTWLVFMKNRLDIAKELLKNDGFIVIQTDDQEQAYLKVLMDEVFNPNHYLNTVTIKVKSSSGVSGGGQDKRLKKNVEFLTIYANDSAQINTPMKQTALNNYIKERKLAKKSFAYTKVMVNPGHREYVGSTKDGRGNPIKLFKVLDYKTMSVKALSHKLNKSVDYVYNHYLKKIYTTENAQTSIRTRVKKAIGNKNDYIIAEYKPVSGKHKNKLTDVGFTGKTKRLVSFLKNTAYEDNGVAYKDTKLGTLWTDISWSSIKKEGNVVFDDGKKPEKLLQRIIAMTTKKGDLVLDFFAGSATTQAVAMKMNRRFIGVEQMNYPVSKTDKTQIYIKRLENVVSGKDTHGISKNINWHGGGSFYYAKMMPYNMKYIDELIVNRNNSSELDTIAKDIFSNARLIATAQLLHADKYYWKNEVGKNAKKKFEYLFNVLDSNLDYYNYNNIDDKNVRKLLSNENYPLDYQFNKNFYGDK